MESYQIQPTSIEKLYDTQRIIDAGLDGLLEHLRKRHKKNGDKHITSTIETYISFIKRYTNELFNENILQSPLTLLAFFNQKLKDSSSPVQRATFITFFEYLGYDYITHKAFLSHLHQVRASANSQTSKRFLQSKVLSRQELNQLFTDEKDPLLRLMYAVGYDSATRRAELCKIKYRNITFFEDETLHKKWIDAQIGASVSVLGKGAKSRTVYLHKMTVDMLNEMYPREQFKSHSGNFKIFVFRQDDGKGRPYKSQMHEYYKRFVISSESILGRPLHPHCLRHTKLTHLANAGCDVLGIMAYAGHEDIQTAMIYIHISTFIGERAFLNHSQPIVDVVSTINNVV